MTASIAAPAWTDDQRRLVQHTVGRGLDGAQLAHLEHVAISRGLDPLSGELIGYAQGGKLTLIATINGMLKLCASSLDGIDAVFYDGNGDEHTVWLSDQPPAACAVSVYRRGCSRAFTTSCRFADYVGNGQPWKRMPSTMIRKCATAAALRLGFADLLAGLYAQEEMEQAGFAPQVEGRVLSAEDEPKQAPRPRKAPLRRSAGRPAEQATEEQAESDGTVLEQLRDDQPQVLPAHDWGHQQAMQALWNKARSLGMTAGGWEALCIQVGDNNAEIQPKDALRIAPLLDAGKVANLNSGLDSFGQPIRPKMRPQPV